MQIFSRFLRRVNATFFLISSKDSNILKLIFEMFEKIKNIIGMLHYYRLIDSSRKRGTKVIDTNTIFSIQKIKKMARRENYCTQTQFGLMQKGGR